VYREDVSYGIYRQRRKAKLVWDPECCKSASRQEGSFLQPQWNFEQENRSQGQSEVDALMLELFDGEEPLI
jgi:hypothetical protein